MSACGCRCVCHNIEGTDLYPGPCAGCCEPGDYCRCGGVLATMYPMEAASRDEFRAEIEAWLDAQA